MPVFKQSRFVPSSREFQAPRKIKVSEANGSRHKSVTRRAQPEPERPARPALVVGSDLFHKPAVTPGYNLAAGHRSSRIIVSHRLNPTRLVAGGVFLSASSLARASSSLKSLLLYSQRPPRTACVGAVTDLNPVTAFHFSRIGEEPSATR